MGAKNVEFQRGTAASWASNESPMGSTPSFDGEAHALFYGFDAAMMLSGRLEELTCGNTGAEIPHYVRFDNSEAAYRVDSVNTAPG